MTDEERNPEDDAAAEESTPEVTPEPAPAPKAPTPTITAPPPPPPADAGAPAGDDLAAVPPAEIGNKKILAGILGIVLGGLGVHKFVLGMNKEGGIMCGVYVISIVLSCIGIGVLGMLAMSIIGLVEGIIYLTKSDEEFYQTYMVQKKGWF